jgi:hypothetical protein
MSKFAEEKFVSSGIYNIINVKHGTSIVRSQNDNGRLTASRGDDNFEVSEHITLISGFGSKTFGHSGLLPC